LTIFKEMGADLLDFPNNPDALGFFTCATYGARKGFRADLVQFLRSQTEARIWVDVCQRFGGRVWVRALKRIAR
jgi:hypothetical protein